MAKYPLTSVTPNLYSALFQDIILPEPILTEADEEEFANQVEPFIPATVDNNAWLGNVANMKDY